MHSTNQNQPLFCVTQSLWAFASKTTSANRLRLVIHTAISGLQFATVLALLIILMQVFVIISDASLEQYAEISVVSISKGLLFLIVVGAARSLFALRTRRELMLTHDASAFFLTYNTVTIRIPAEDVTCIEVCWPRDHTMVGIRIHTATFRSSLVGQWDHDCAPSELLEMFVGHLNITSESVVCFQMFVEQDGRKPNE